MKSFLAVGIGGFLGAICRYSLGLSLSNNGGFPFATLCMNLFGCFCLAWLFTTFTKRTPVIIGIGTGFFGAFTTFSTFSLETLLLLQDSKWLQAVLYILVSVFGGLACAWLGFKLAKGRIV
ncbi:fluoride efflux transporter CrcB [Lysinibacillus xylanilyticus]|uniref:fluoride efflux transporter CrcB n=1 Tax=Lysinibacillus xylanilyticus TaxID=582475 RepID=UPI002B24C2C9|nr:fluoride efflux transporter CrcB [Lysinibacillus xylanilyticus]MEB2281705.1 fluoride efflux transporter CrcB [Lysinibacillus xylanilyticus]